MQYFFKYIGSLPVITYPLEFREKVLRIKKEQNLTMALTAERFHINVSTVNIWCRKVTPNFKAKLDIEALKLDIANHPNDSLMKRAKRLHVSGTCVWRALQRPKFRTANQARDA